MANKTKAGARMNMAKTTGLCHREQSKCKCADGGVMLIKGPYDKIVAEALRFSEETDCSIIDAADILNPLNACGNEPNIVSAPVTAFQLKRFVDNELKNYKNSQALVILSLKNLFFDSNIKEDEYLSMFNEIISKIREFSEKNSVSVVNFEFSEQFEHPRDEDLTKMLEISADWLVKLAPEIKVSTDGRVYV